MMRRREWRGLKLAMCMAGRNGDVTRDFTISDIK